MAKWLISCLGKQFYDDYFYDYEYSDKSKELDRCSLGDFFGKNVSGVENEDDAVWYDGKNFKEKLLIYDDEKNEFSKEFIIGDDYDDIGPELINAKLSREDMSCIKIEPEYEDQTILGDLWLGDPIPKDHIRYFVVNIHILDNDEKTRMYRIIGNDQTNCYVDEESLNRFLEKGQIINHEELKELKDFSGKQLNRISVWDEAEENINRRRCITKFQLIFETAKAFGIDQPELDYLFQGSDVIVTGINKEWIEKNRESYLLSGIKKLYIPQGVTRIAEDAFSREKVILPIHKVILPSSLKEIGNNAFLDMDEIEYMECTSGSGLVRIGKCAFCGCEKLDIKLRIDDGLTEIENWAFKSCKTVELCFGEKTALNRIGEQAFHSAKVKFTYPESHERANDDDLCDGEENEVVVIPEGVTCIEHGAFAYTDIHSVILPEQLKRLSAFAFFKSKISRVPKFPVDLEEVGNSCFSECEIMEGTLVLPETVKKVGDRAFLGCKSIIKAVFGPKVKTINAGCFEDCTSLCEVVFSEGLLHISYGAFLGCENLHDISIPSSVIEINSSAFSGCVALGQIDYDPSVLYDLDVDSFVRQEMNRRFYGLAERNIITFLEEPLEKGDLVVFLRPCKSSMMRRRMYGVVDHLTDDAIPRAVVWTLPGAIYLSGKDEVDYSDEMYQKPVLYEVSGLRARKVSFDENNLNQRIFINYIKKKTGIG